MNEHRPQRTTSRRQFLAAASATATGVLLLGADTFGGPSGLQLLAVAPGARIPVAYVEGSGGASSLAAALAAGPRRAVPAAAIRQEDTLAGRAALITVEGLASAHHARLDMTHAVVLLDAHVPSPASRDETIPFFAFTYRRAADAISSPSRLRLAAGRGLRVGFRLVTTGATEESSTTVFTSRPHDDHTTMQPGVYLLGLRQSMWSSATNLPTADDAAWAELPSLVVIVEAEELQ